ncbi:MAG: glycosyltransferase family 4 protein [Candidatus Nitrohelix vancouverensis]|uniref:Glycosyltransferase family 4 protein n=1 Tax=Candidatus Nitrohelix vancouverensis TaxID=2705534 RepID=A0A7T0C1Y0_9BACT|nr:MAG: glycosyltransferase family 4 protein [Candidatus Nitrohelix vancouverensis]
MIVSSRFEYDDAVEFGIEKQNIHIIPMGIDVAADATAHRPESPHLKLLFAGRIALVRRLELALLAVHKLTIPWELTLVGGEAQTSSVTRGGYVQELKRLARTLGIENQVHFIGPKSKAELKEYYKTADLFLYPSLYENFSQPLLEAAAAGLPLVATRVGIAPDIAEQSGAILCEGEPESLQRGIETLADRKARQEMGAAAQDAVRAGFSWETILQQYRTLYQSL